MSAVVSVWLEEARAYPNGVVCTPHYLASAAGKGSAGAWIAGRLGWFRHAPKGQQAAAAGVAAAAVVGLAAAALALTGHSGPAPAHRALPPAAAGAPA